MGFIDINIMQLQWYKCSFEMLIRFYILKYTVELPSLWVHDFIFIFISVGDLCFLKFKFSATSLH